MLLKFLQVDGDTDVEDADMLVDEEIRDRDIAKKNQKPSDNVITTALVESWCNSVRENGKISAVRSLLKAFRIACHYGDDGGGDASAKYTIMSSSVFNKVMLFVLSEMDGILRNVLGLPAYGGKKETVNDLLHTKKWMNYHHLAKSYLGNALYVLNQMTDTQMISFTLRRLKFSSVLLVAFPALLRKYIKVRTTCLIIFLFFRFFYVIILITTRSVALECVSSDEWSWSWCTLIPLVS
jgi:nucleolar complex protein 2